MLSKRSITARRLTAFCLAFLVLFSTLTACTPNEESSVPEKEDTKQTQPNKPTGNDEVTTPSDNVTTPSDEETKPTEPEQTQPSTENTTPTEPEGTQPPTNNPTPTEPEETQPSAEDTKPSTPTDPVPNKLDILGGTDFSDGVAFVRYVDNNGNKKGAAIDTKGTILFEVDYWSVGDYQFEDGIFIEDNCIYDKTGKIIASPELSGYDELISENCNGFVLAKKTEQSFSGDLVYIGVLNNEGRWEHPLSADNPIVKEMIKEDADVYIYNYPDDGIIYMELGLINYWYYHLKTNRLTRNYIHYETNWPIFEGADGVCLYDELGNCTVVLPDVLGEQFYDDVIIGTYVGWDTTGEYTHRPYRIYDYSGNVITDLTQYVIRNLDRACYKNEHLLAVVDNGTGAKYLCLFNKAGEPAFEPIRMESGDRYYSLNEDGFVYYESSRRCYKFYDYTGKCVEYTGVISFDDFHDGLALVEMEDYTYCYINIRGEVVIN